MEYEGNRQISSAILLMQYIKDTNHNRKLTDEEGLIIIYSEGLQATCIIYNYIRINKNVKMVYEILTGV